MVSSVGQALAGTWRHGSGDDDPAWLLTAERDILWLLRWLNSATVAAGFHALRVGPLVQAWEVGRWVPGHKHEQIGDGLTPKSGPWNQDYRVRRSGGSTPAAGHAADSLFPLRR